MPFRLRLPAFLALLQERHQRCLGGVADDLLEAPGALRQGAMQVGGARFDGARHQQMVGAAQQRLQRVVQVELADRRLEALAEGLVGEFLDPLGDPSARRFRQQRGLAPVLAEPGGGEAPRFRCVAPAPEFEMARVAPEQFVGAFAEKHAVIALLADTVGQALVHQQAGHPCRPAEVADRATQQRHEGFLAQLEALQPRVWQQAFLVAFQAQVKALQLRVQVAAEQVGIDPAADQQGAGRKVWRQRSRVSPSCSSRLSTSLAGAVASRWRWQRRGRSWERSKRNTSPGSSRRTCWNRVWPSSGTPAATTWAIASASARAPPSRWQRPRLGGEGQQAALGLVAVVQRLDAELVAQQGQLPGLRVPAGEGVHAVRQYPALQAVEQQADLAMDFAAGLVDLAVVGDPPLASCGGSGTAAAPDIGRRVMPMAPFGRAAMPSPNGPRWASRRSAPAKRETLKPVPT